VLITFSSDCYVHRRVLHPFPTRRSSDLSALSCPQSAVKRQRNGACARASARARYAGNLPLALIPPDEHAFGKHVYRARADARARSEEHTSELQSRSDLVCRLLLEKKKNQ